MDFNGNQTVQGPNESFSAALNDTRRSNDWSFQNIGQLLLFLVVLYK